jgi:N-acetylmuramoyl-L-alanine amidase
MILVLKRKNIFLVAIAILLTLTIVGVNIFVKNGEPSNAAEIEPVNVSGKGKIVVIDAGHGGEDPGAVSKYSDAKEKDLDLTVAKKLQALLEKSEYTVIMTRTEDILQYEGDDLSMTAKRRQDLQKRKKLMDESNADIVVSIHLNSFGDTKYSGAQVFYTKDSKSSQKLAMCIQDALRQIVDKDNKREALLKKDDIIITKNCKATTVIVECGFLSNQAEEAKLRDGAYQDKIVEAIKYGIDTYFCPPAGVETPAPPSAATPQPVK